MKKIVLLFLFCMLIICVDVFADTIYLKNGTQFIGRVVRQDAEKVVFKVGGEQDGIEVTFFNESVLRIDKQKVSSFITLPFGEGKQINIPRPIFSKEPLLTEQAKAQLEQRSKTEEAEQAKAKLKEEESELEKDKQTGPQLEELSKGAPRGEVSKQQAIIEELVTLLDKEEKDYFSKINSLIQNAMSKMTSVIANPMVSTQDSAKLEESINQVRSETQDIIKQIEEMEVPAIFTNFHKMYLDNLNLMQDVLLDMSKGDIQNSQSKLEQVQQWGARIQEELSRILAEKKSKSL